MSKLVDDMLRLARLDQRPGRDNEVVDLSAMVAGCAERARVTGERRTWQADIAPGLVTMGDEELLRRAVDNLLANVCTHTPNDAAATINAARHGGVITVEVSDDGPGGRRTACPTSSTAFTGPPPRARNALAQGWASPSSPRSPLPITAPSRPSSTSRKACGSRSCCRPARLP